MEFVDELDIEAVFSCDRGMFLFLEKFPEWSPVFDESLRVIEIRNESLIEIDGVLL